MSSRIVSLGVADEGGLMGARAYGSGEVGAMTPLPDWLRLYARKIVAWNEATESAAVPATDWADRIIDRVPAPSDTTRGATAVEITRELERLRAELEQRTAERDSAREKVEQLFEIAEAAQKRAKNAIERAQITMDRILGRTRT